MESFAEEAGDSTVDVEVQPPYPFNQRLLSSEDSEEEEQEEAAELPASPWHPKPLGVSVATLRKCVNIIVFVECVLTELCVAAMHFRMPHVGLQHLHLRPALAAPARRPQCHAGAPRQRTPVEVSIAACQQACYTCTWLQGGGGTLSSIHLGFLQV